MNPKVAVLTLNWNGWKDTIRCLEALYRLNYNNYHIIIVDNASTDESLAKLDVYCTSKLQLASHFTK